MVINETEKNERWKLGKIFFKKYNIIFDHNYKTIGIYDDKYNKSNTALIVFEWIFAIILVTVALYLGYKLYKRYRLNNYKKYFKNKNEIKNNNIDEERSKSNFKFPFQSMQ